MKRTKLDDRTLPNYSKENEIFNYVTHIIGGAVGIVALVLCVIKGALNHSAYAVVGGSIFGASMITMYTISSVYHGLSPRLKAKKVMQILDHCTIFVLIAGTYTPIALCNIREYNTALGWSIFGVVWGAAVLGIVFNSIDLKKYKKFSMICYIMMGWCVIVIADKIPMFFTKEAFLLILGGGIVYTIGAILYGVGKKHLKMHGIFHICTIIASIMHFFAIYLYVM